MISPDFESPYEFLHIIGQGGEGTVYLVRDKESGSKHILKIFHSPIQGTSANGLRAYAAKIRENEVGLPVISLIGSDNQVDALHYPYFPLYNVHWRLLSSFEKIGQILFGAYCHMQHYLMSHCGIGLSDTDVGHFLLSEQGQFHFVDYGFAIKSINHTHYLDQGRFGYGFAMLLLSIHQMNLKLETLPTPAYDYNAPCRYSFSRQLDVVAEKHTWVKEILAEVRRQKSSIFLDPLFYKELGERFPHRVLLPQLIIGASNVLSNLRNFRPQRVRTHRKESATS
ncbi:MAG: hypothetical protein KF893_08585 [Caldilineaceae bacterium]|nr:hypothetical protein [Caldilineaceae bacterium]